MKKKYLILLPLLAMSLSGCVKYNGRASSNYDEKLTLTLSQASLQIEEGSSAKLTAKVSNRNATVNWTVESEGIATLSADKGFEVTVSALIPGTTTITAVAALGNDSIEKTCSLEVTRKGVTPPTPGPGPTPQPDDPNAPKEGEEVTTYLVIGEYGLYTYLENEEVKTVKGQDIPELYLEYAIKFDAKVGDDLPTEENITSTVSGSEFQGWKSYEGTGALVTHTKVPAARGKILYASFGGGQGGVPVPPEPQPEPQGTVTLYFAGLANWGSDALSTVDVNLAVNLDWKAATSVSLGVYKAQFEITKSVTNINAYFHQDDNGTDKYFHPTSGTQDYDVMNSNISFTGVTVEPGKSYTITFTDWHYHSGNDSWFYYSFAEGEPGDEPTPTPTPTPTPSEDAITVYFAGVNGWSIKEVHIAFDTDWTNSLASTTTEVGQYVNTCSSDTASALNIYFIQHEDNMDKYRHPTKTHDDTDSDTDYSTIDLGGMTLQKGHSYVVTWTGWTAHTGEHWEHAWFEYTFAELNA